MKVMSDYLRELIPKRLKFRDVSMANMFQIMEKRQVQLAQAFKYKVKILTLMIARLQEAVALSAVTFPLNKMPDAPILDVDIVVRFTHWCITVLHNLALKTFMVASILKRVMRKAFAVSFSPPYAMTDIDKVYDRAVADNLPQS
ncbi:Hypothetical protein PHPALM_6882 [Phytophthora palmivora]|uniref:Uncharacterized protein n=1 Tax=Phytophthora palmivora TaxID=4796 RepID=A0A2P4YDP1_9STRA|nr:Hypothetical protein PHPALM_6882 [Phytophthora palmivora]